jgi:hypothetical protein
MNSNHNGDYIVFLFRTENEYRKNSSDYKKTVLEESELRKILLKTDDIEMGITIEDSLKEPTENIWGYTFGHYKYYIIKNDVLTITESRSKIRKIYKGITETDKPYLIRIETDLTWYTKEIGTISKLAEKVYECEIDDEIYLISNDDALLKYASKLIKLKENKDFLIGMLGGVDEIVKSYICGNIFNSETYFRFNENDMCDFIGIEKEQYGDIKHRVVFSDIEIDNNEFKLSKLQLYKKL